MITQILIKDYYLKTRELKRILTKNPLLYKTIKNNPDIFIHQPSSNEISDLILGNKKLHKLLLNNPDLIDLMKEEDRLKQLFQQYPKVDQVISENKHLFENNPNFSKLLIGIPDFIDNIFETEELTQDDIILFSSLTSKVDEYKRRVLEGNLIPLFFKTKNKKSGYIEINLKLNNYTQISEKESLKSLEVILTNMLDRKTDIRVIDGFLSKNFNIQLDTESEESTKEISGFDLLFNTINSLNLNVFKYILWLISGNAEIEIEKQLSLYGDSFRRLDKGIITDINLLKVGHTKNIKFRKNKITTNEYLKKLGCFLVSTMIGTKEPEKALVEPYFLSQLYIDNDINFEKLKKNLNDLDFIELKKTLQYCTSDSFLFKKQIVRTFIEEVENIDSGNYGIYEFYDEHNVNKIKKRHTGSNIKESFLSLFNSLLSAFRVNNTNSEAYFKNISEKDFSKQLTLFRKTFIKLKNHKPFQISPDFLAAYGELNGKLQSSTKKFVFSLTPLSELLKIFLQKRYDDITPFLEVIVSYEYSLLKRLAGNMLNELNNINIDVKSNGLFPDPLIIEKGDEPSIKFSKSQFHNSFNDFAKYLSLQMFAVITGKASFNEPAIWLYENLETRTSFDHLIQSLWGQGIQTLEETINLMLDFKQNQVEYMIQYRKLKQNSKLELEKKSIDINVTPTRDSSVFSRYNTTVLVVEDNDLNMKYINVILKKLGCKVIQAYNGKEGLDHYHEFSNAIDLIISDIQMPIMNGVEFYDNIQIINPEIPFLICSADSLCDFAKKNEDIFIGKPFSEKELNHKIREIMAKKVPSKYAEMSN